MLPRPDTPQFGGSNDVEVPPQSTHIGFNDTLNSSCMTSFDSVVHLQSSYTPSGYRSSDTPPLLQLDADIERHLVDSQQLVMGVPDLSGWTTPTVTSLPRYIPTQTNNRVFALSSTSLPVFVPNHNKLQSLTGSHNNGAWFSAFPPQKGPGWDTPRLSTIWSRDSPEMNEPMSELVEAAPRLQITANLHQRGRKVVWENREIEPSPQLSERDHRALKTRVNMNQEERPHAVPSHQSVPSFSANHNKTVFNVAPDNKTWDVGSAPKQAVSESMSARCSPPNPPKQMGEASARTVDLLHESFDSVSETRPVKLSDIDNSAALGPHGDIRLSSTTTAEPDGVNLDHACLVSSTTESSDPRWYSLEEISASQDEALALDDDSSEAQPPVPDSRMCSNGISHREAHLENLPPTIKITPETPSNVRSKLYDTVEVDMDPSLASEKTEEELPNALSREEIDISVAPDACAQMVDVDKVSWTTVFASGADVNSPNALCEDYSSEVISFQRIGQNAAHESGEWHEEAIPDHAARLTSVAPAQTREHEPLSQKALQSQIGERVRSSLDGDFCINQTAVDGLMDSLRCEKQHLPSEADNTPAFSNLQSMGHCLTGETVEEWTINKATIPFTPTEAMCQAAESFFPNRNSKLTDSNVRAERLSDMEQDTRIGAPLRHEEWGLLEDQHKPSPQLSKTAIEEASEYRCGKPPMWAPSSKKEIEAGRSNLQSPGSRDTVALGSDAHSFTCNAPTNTECAMQSSEVKEGGAQTSSVNTEQTYPLFVLPTGESRHTIPRNYNGWCQIFWSADEYYVGEWSDGAQNGFGVYTWPGRCACKDNAQFVGQWKKGLRHGYGEYIYASGRRDEGWWLRNQRQGLVCTTFVDGTMVSGRFD